MNIKSKKIRWITVSATLIFMAGCGFVYHALFRSPFQLTDTAYVYIDDTDTAESICKKVKDEGHASSMIGYHIMATLKGYGDKKHTGRYAITPHENMFNLVRHMSNGVQSPVDLVVPSVRTVDKLTESLSKQLMLDAPSLMALLNDSTYINQLGYTKETLPCLFIPNTYEVYWNIKPADLIKRLEKEKKRFWNESRLTKAKADSLSPEQVVTLASIVESETNYNPEKPAVAALYLNRLHTGMKLQSDPTVKFALQQFGLRRILLEHLTYDSPYNTYMYQGLPPGPICIPSTIGIDAVLNHDKHNYIYMCAKEDFSGSHNFAVTYAEHQKNASRYQKALNERGIK